MNARRFSLAGVILLLVPMLGLGCASKKPAESTPTPPVETPTPPPPPPAPPADPPSISLKVETTPPAVATPCDGILTALKSYPIRFDVDSSSLGADAATSVDKMAEAIKGSGIQSSLRVRIDGHCDETGSEGYNIALGDRRAEAVRQRLIKLGVVDGSSAQTSSFGEQQPLDADHTPDAYAKNRRAEISLTAGCSNP